VSAVRSSPWRNRFPATGGQPETWPTSSASRLPLSAPTSLAARCPAPTVASAANQSGGQTPSANGTANGRADPNPTQSLPNRSRRRASRHAQWIQRDRDPARCQARPSEEARGSRVTISLRLQGRAPGAPGHSRHARFRASSQRPPATARHAKQSVSAFSSELLSLGQADTALLSPHPRAP